MKKKILRLFFLGICLMLFGQVISCKKKNIIIVPYFAIYGDKGINSFISTGLEKNQPDFSEKLDTFKVANYIFEGDFEFDSTTIKKHVLNFLDTAMLTYINSNNICKIRFYKTSRTTNKNFRDNGIDGYIPTEDFIAEIIYKKDKPSWLYIYINGELVLSYEFDSLHTNSSSQIK